MPEPLTEGARMPLVYPRPPINHAVRHGRSVSRRRPFSPFSVMPGAETISQSPWCTRDYVMYNCMTCTRPPGQPSKGSSNNGALPQQCVLRFSLCCCMHCSVACAQIDAEAYVQYSIACNADVWAAGNNPRYWKADIASITIKLCGDLTHWFCLPLQIYISMTVIVLCHSESNLLCAQSMVMQLGVHPEHRR